MNLSTTKSYPVSDVVDMGKNGKKREKKYTMLQHSQRINNEWLGVVQIFLCLISPRSDSSLYKNAATLRQRGMKILIIENNADFQVSPIVQLYLFYQFLFSYH